MKIRDLRLSDGGQYIELYRNSDGRIGELIIERWKNRHYFTAKLYGSAMPCRAYRVTLGTDIQSLRDDAIGA